MKKVRDRFIKNLRYLCLIGVIALGLMTIVGTDGGGGGGDGGTSEDTSSTMPNGETETDVSTSLISAYMAIIHGQEIDAFEEDQKAIDREDSAHGQFLSGGHVKRYMANLTNHIQNFVDNSVQYISQVADTKPIDKIAIEELFEDYNSTDIAYMKTFTNAHLAPHGEGIVLLAIEELTPDINDIYDIALLQIEIL